MIRRIKSFVFLFCLFIFGFGTGLHAQRITTFQSQIGYLAGGPSDGYTTGNALSIHQLPDNGFIFINKSIKY